MNILVTAGNTWTMLDRVRCITNIFTGRTGANVAREAHRRGHRVTLLTSHPDTVRELEGRPHWCCLAYRTFEDLHHLMETQIRGGPLDAILHSAAVSDYRSAGIFSSSEFTHFEPDSLTWQGQPPRLEDRAAGKVKSDADELWIRLVRTPKLVDFVRTAWGFRKTLVKFKLEVGISEAQLLDIAERSRRQSEADLIVANTLDEANDWALLGDSLGYVRVARAELACRLIDAVEKVQHG